jgi:hypothetical protein
MGSYILNDLPYFPSLARRGEGVVFLRNLFE